MGWGDNSIIVSAAALIICSTIRLDIGREREREGLGRKAPPLVVEASQYSLLYIVVCVCFRRTFVLTTKSDAISFSLCVSAPVLLLYSQVLMDY